MLRKIEAQAYYNYVDHVMDNYSLRTPPMNSAMRMASNPDRKTTGGRLAFTLIPDDQHKVVMGLDRQDNQHTVRQRHGRRTHVALHQQTQAGRRPL